MPRDPYRVLDVEMDASQAEIKLAFRQLTKRTHPDVNPSDNAAETFRRINAAYEIVGDAERRRRFDLGNDWEVRYQILKSCNVGLPIPDSLSLTSIPNISPSSQAMDEGWMPEAETKARARTAAYNPNSQAAAKPPNSRRKREGMDVAVFDEDRRQAGLNRLYWIRFKRVWGVWCKMWMAGLNVGVPVASAYFVVVGLMHEKLPMFR